MRASTLFALTIAVLIGLGVAVATRVSGIFRPEPPAQVKQQEIKVLVAKKNLFAGDLIDGSGVQIRPLRPEELSVYEQNKDQYLPPVTAAAELRISRENIAADEPILKKHLEEMSKPEPLHSRLMPTMRAITVEVEKDKSAGGMIQTGEWVDVLLTSQIEDPSGKTTVRTAPIATRVRVIAKRNTLWPVFAPLEKGKPVPYTLEVNPYRASLIEYGRTRGQLSLMPLPISEQKKLESQRTALLQGKEDDIQQVHFVQAGTPEAEEEDSRVTAYSRGEMVIGEDDLMRIFGVTTNAPPEQNITIQQLGGINHYSPAVFNPHSQQRIYPSGTGTQVSANRNVSTVSAGVNGFTFRTPDGCTKKKG